MNNEATTQKRRNDMGHHEKKHYLSALRSFSPSSRSRLHLRGVGVDLKKPALRS